MGLKKNTLKVLLHYFTITLKKKVRKRGVTHLKLKDKTRETIKTKQNNKKSAKKYLLNYLEKNNPFQIHLKEKQNSRKFNRKYLLNLKYLMSF